MNTTEAVRGGIRAAGRSGVRLLIAGGIVFSSLLLWLFLALFPGTGEGAFLPGDLFRELTAHDDPTLLVLFIVSASTLLWTVWSAITGGALRSNVLALRGEPAGVATALGFALKHWASFFFTPILFLLTIAFGMSIVYALVSLTRVPVVGWPFFLLFSPLVLFIALAVVGYAARYVIGGHLAGAVIASGNGGSFTALNRASAYARRAPVRLVLSRLQALLLVVLHASWRVLLIGSAFALIGLFINWRDTSNLAWFCMVPLLLMGASWLLAWPVSLCLGARAGLYLALRQELDGVDIQAVEADPQREKSLEELGFELVERLRKEED